jgi:hypothetical protein
MPTIAIIDDRRNLRKSLKTALDLELEDINGEWSSIDLAPLKSMNEYPLWIHKKDVAAILLDEKLAEKIEAKKSNIKYFGHDFVDYIRKYYPSLPIYFVTSYATDPELVKRAKDVEYILSREAFSKDSKEWVTRILRSTNRFIDSVKDELDTLSELSKKIAIGKAKRFEIKKANAIRLKINCAFLSDVFVKRSKLISDLEKELDKLGSIYEKIKKHKDVK